MERTASEVWQLYEKGRDYLHKIDLVDKTDRFHRFYLGDQWYGVKSGGEELPVFNFIKGIVKYKVSTVAHNAMTANYSPVDSDTAYLTACEQLNQHFARMWERGKLDSLSWKLIKDACIQGDAYLFFGEGGDITAGQLIDNVNIFLADEKNPDLQEQRHIIIRERRFAEDIRREAKAAGLEPDDIALITSDDDTEDQIGDRTEVDYSSERGKCTSLLYMYKDEEGYVHALRCLKNLIYQSDTLIRAADADGNFTELGLKSYPVVNFIWEDKKGSARGAGEVEWLIPNQLEVNKTLARRSIAVKQGAYPKLAYAEGAISNPADLDLIGAAIAVKNGTAQNINNMISYLSPTAISADAKNLSDELIKQSRELSGAGDSATGSIDPTQASGAAIIAVRDQAALPLNEQVGRYQQVVEDLAYLWYDLWTAYNPNGIEIETEEADPMTGMPGKAVIPAAVLEQMKVNVRVDVSQTNPYSKFAQEQGLQNLFAMKAISFDEYVEALDDDAAIPKGKLMDILEKRAVQAQKEAQYQQAIAGLTQEKEQLAGEAEGFKSQLAAMGGQLQQSTEAIRRMTGGNQGEMQGMQY